MVNLFHLQMKVFGLKNLQKKLVGRLDNNTLQRVQNFNFDGMIVNKETFLENGGLKSNMKLTFTYEFLIKNVLQINSYYGYP